MDGAGISSCFPRRRPFFALIVRGMIRDKRSGKSGCGGNCGDCGACHGCSSCRS